MTALGSSPASAASSGEQEQILFGTLTPPRPRGTRPCRAGQEIVGILVSYLTEPGERWNRRLRLISLALPPSPLRTCQLHKRAAAATAALQDITSAIAAAVSAT